jgi:hypothetical protein
VDFLFYSGYVALAYWHARAAATAMAAGAGADNPHLRDAADYFARILPRTATLAALLKPA